MEKLTITTVADPMMGMLWETWPTMRKLETHFPNQIEVHYLMGQLVKDVYDLVDQNVMKKYDKTVALNQYWTKLMQIYYQEQSIGNMPIYMGGDERLFDTEHTSSIPLNKGLRAIAGRDSKLEDQVLYEMQYDTVVNDKQTNNINYLVSLAKKFGIDKNKFKNAYNSDAVQAELDREQSMLYQMKITQLPSYLITYQGKTFIIKGIPRYSDWLSLIKQVTNDQIKEQKVKFDFDHLKKFIDEHPHISSLELKEAFDANEKDVVKMLSDTDLEQTNVKEVMFYRKK